MLWAVLAAAAAAAQPSAVGSGGPPFGEGGVPELALQRDVPPAMGAAGWLLTVDAATYLRDAAFELPYTRGYTATGFFLDPAARLFFGGRGCLTAGLRLAGVAGYDGIRAWQPLLRLEYQPRPWVRMVMGTLYGGLSHRFYEPMLDRERYVYDHHEEGVQVLVGAGGRLTSDTYLNWENLLEPWQADQERFTLGSRNELWLLRGPAFDLTIPFAFLGSHRGGQFTSLDTCIQSLFNESVGLRAALFPRGRHSVEAVLPLFLFQDVSPSPKLPYQRGWGVWPQVSYRGALGDVWSLAAVAGWWRGWQYIAPRGSYLFQSVSWHLPDAVFPDRSMLTFRLAVEHRWQEDFALGIDAELYSDLLARGTDFAFGLYMRYQPRWSLSRIKN